MLDRQINGEMALVVARQRLAQFRDAPLPGIKCLTTEQRFACCPVDEIRRRKIALACPERKKSVAATRIVDDLDDTSFRFGDLAGAKAVQQGHGKSTPSISAECLTDRWAKIP